MATSGGRGTALVLLRGNSGSGKSTTARRLRERLGRGVAWVEQDHLRRVVLREHDVPGAANVGLIDVTVRYALEHGFDVVLEGILNAGHYGDMLAGLAADHAGATLAYYFDVPFDETVRRHATKPNAADFGAAEMRAWYRERDLLAAPAETVLDAAATADETATRIVADLRRAGVTRALAAG